jgi:Helix-turn-helix domain
VRARTLSEKHLTQSELAARWRMSPRTLERWRWLRQGPAFLKLGAGGHVVYRLEDIEDYERQHLQLAKSTSFLNGAEALEIRHGEPQANAAP